MQNLKAVVTYTARIGNGIYQDITTIGDVQIWYRSTGRIRCKFDNYKGGSRSDDFRPGQYTLLFGSGINDANNVEMFEGDVVKHTQKKGVTGTVIFEHGSFMVDWGQDIARSYLHHVDYLVQVTSNIHLLKAKLNV